MGVLTAETMYTGGKLDIIALLLIVSILDLQITRCEAFTCSFRLEVTSEAQTSLSWLGSWSGVAVDETRDLI
jgi:hypothetical protein